MTNRKHCKHLQTFFRLNIALGLVAAVTAIWFLVTGEYANLAERRHMEAILNAVVVGSIVYSVAGWFISLYFQPRLEACIEQA